MSNILRPLSPPPSPPKEQPHPVYSDFSHIATSMGIGNTKFAVGLRESNSEELINRILPLAKVVPGQKKERVIRKFEKEEKICSRPECVARRETFQEMNSENEHLRVMLRKAEGKVSAARNRVALSEKSVDMAEARNEALRAQIDEAQAKIVSVESVVEKSEGRNQVLRNQYLGLQQEIESLKAQAESYRRQTSAILDTDLGPRMVFVPGPKPLNDDTRDVSTLSCRDNDSDSD